MPLSIKTALKTIKTDYICQSEAHLISGFARVAAPITQMSNTTASFTAKVTLRPNWLQLFVCLKHWRGVNNSPFSNLPINGPSRASQWDLLAPVHNFAPALSAAPRRGGKRVRLDGTSRKSPNQHGLASPPAPDHQICDPGATRGRLSFFFFIVFFGINFQHHFPACIFQDVSSCWLPLGIFVIYHYLDFLWFFTDFNYGGI